MEYTMKNIYFTLFITLVTIGLISSCNDDHDHDHEQELITTLIYTLTPKTGGSPVVMTFQDPDGDGGIAPSITTEGVLLAGISYEGSIVLRNESVMPPRDITTEIKEEADKHQFFFQALDGVAGRIKFDYADIDNNGNPVGLLTDVFGSGGPANGKIRVILRHEPKKDAAGVKFGSIANAGGETDIDVTFHVAMQ
jgi:hypothetical protein